MLKVDAGLSREQLEVVQSDAPALMVKASAGAGKTRVLVARYLKHVQTDGIRPDQILTVTFTRKAAAEMKRRIVDALLASGLDESAQIAETGPIQTLHSFCERLLRENALAAQIDPDYEILDGAEANRWVELAIKQSILETEADKHRYAEHFLDHTAGRKDRDDPSPMSVAEGLIRSALHGIRGTLLEPDALLTRHADPAALVQDWRRRLLQELQAPVQSLDTASPTFWTDFRAAMKEAKATKPSWLPSYAQLETSGPAEHLAAELTAGLVDLCVRAWRALEGRMAEEQKFDFAYLERRALDLLQSGSVIDRLRRQYRVLLVDESQDLNPVQYALLTSLQFEREMAVGDAQQSIYGFRQADVSLFVERTQTLPTLHLPRNYRSSAPVLGAVDQVFGSVWSGAYLPMMHEQAPTLDKAEVELWTFSDFSPTYVSERIAELLEEESPGDIAVLVNKNDSAVNLHARLELMGIPARIGGGGTTFYTRLEVRDIANLLSCLTDPSNDMAMLAALRGPAVELSLDAIALLASQLPVAVSLPGIELPNLQDQEKLAKFRQWFEPASATADRKSAWEVLSDILAETDLLANLATRPNPKQTISNVRKLLMMAAERPELGPGEFAQTIREIQALKHKEGDAPFIDGFEDAVTIMTIHKAKGLEFPVVILPELHKTKPAPAGRLEIDKRSGLFALKLEKEPLAIRDLLASERQARERDELLRLLYVGMTRAERKLCIVVDDRPTAKSLAVQVWALLNPAVSGQNVKVRPLAGDLPSVENP
jgi:ATP-dependent helicase/nuclease subunit A